MKYGMRLSTTTAVAFALLVLMGYTLIRYKSHSMEAFCESVPLTATPQSVLAQAEAQQFRANDQVETRGIVAVFNQRSPYFRFACNVAFKDGHVIGRRVLAAD